MTGVEIGAQKPNPASQAPDLRGWWESKVWLIVGYHVGRLHEQPTSCRALGVRFCMTVVGAQDIDAPAVRQCKQMQQLYDPGHKTGGYTISETSMPLSFLLGS